MDVHVYFHEEASSAGYAEVTRLLNKIIKKEDTLMATLQELTTVIGQIGSEVTKVAADTDVLLAKLDNIPTGGLTPEQQTALDSAVTSANEIAARLQVIDDKVPDSIPMPPNA